MKITRNWLAEFVELSLPISAIAERLTMSGFEVESITEQARDLADIRCAQIVRVHPHPQADRLSVCDLHIGDGGTATVVCGATNVHAGDRVAYAPPGVVLPDGRQLAATEVRGVLSAGMLCSEHELGLGPDASTILILPSDAGIGARVSAVLGIEDTVLDIAVTPNRGDCLSVLGIAREVAALTGQRLRRRQSALREADEPASPFAVIQIADADLCGRYVARIVSDVNVGPSPLWMRRRLEAVGVRPINNVVDVTNYVMIERGQPLHAFDYERLPQPEITVRRAGSLVKFTTLDGQERELHADDLLITSGGQPIAIAGVMGGAETEVTVNTRRILLESAWFAPTGIRRTVRRLGLRTEASYRFERTTDIEDTPVAAGRAAALIVQVSGGSVARGQVETYPSAWQAAPITLRVKRIEDLLGVPVSRSEAVSRLKALGLGVVSVPRGTLMVTPPAYRSDLSREVDVIEEIIRVSGYENVPVTLPASRMLGTGEGIDRRRQRDLRRILAAQGLNEAVSLSFCSSRSNELFSGLVDRQTPVPILNPVTQDDRELRLSLCPGLIRIVRHNLDQGMPHVAVFSIGKVFWRGDAFCEGRRTAGALSRLLPAAGLGSREMETEFADLKGIVETVLDFFGIRGVRWVPASDLTAFHPGKTARIGIGDISLGVAGALHPALEEELEIEGSCWLFELDWDRLLQYCPSRVNYRDLPRFPAVVRDLAVVAEASFAADEILRFVRAWDKAGELIEDISLFDQYTGPPIATGKKSLAYSISYRAPDRTLTDTEVNDVHGRLVAAVKEALHVEPRQ